MEQPVGKELATRIMEATGRFEFIKEFEDGFLIFFGL